MASVRTLRGSTVPGRFLGVALGLVATTCLVTAWHSTGTTWDVVGWWALVVGLGVLAPGWALVRLTRRRGGPTDLAWAFPTGLMITLLVWFVGRLVDQQLSSPAVGAAITVVLLGIGVLRDRHRPSGGALRVLSPTGALGVLVGVGGAMAVATRWMWRLGLVVVPPVPDPSLPTYHQDLVYQTALTGELRRNLVPGYPMVDGEPLSYHWFFHAAAAQLGGNGVHDIDVVMRLLPATLVIGLVGLAAAVGYQVTGHGAGAVGSALAVAAVSPLAGDPWPTATTLNIIQTYWQVSSTATLGWVFGLALTGTAIAMIRRGATDRVVPIPLIAPLAFATAGAKSAQVPVVLAGVGLAALAWVVLGHRRSTWWRVIRRYAVIVVVLVAAALLATKLLYPVAYGLRLAPFEGVKESVASMVGEARMYDSTIVGGFGVWFLRVWAVMLLCSLGTVRLIRRRPLDPSGWIGVGALVAGLGALLLLMHPGRSQLYFLVAAFPVVLCLSGAGIADACRAVVLAARSGSTPRARAGTLAVPLTIASGIAVGVLVRQVYAGRVPPIDALAASARVRELLLAWAQPAALLVAGLVVAGLVGWLVARPALPRRASRGLAVALVGLAAASASLVSLVPVIRLDAPGLVADRQRLIQLNQDLQHPPITKALFDAGAYLRTHAAPTDIVATNRVFNGKTFAGGHDNRDFAVPALSGLRADVAGFGYAGRMLDRGPDDLAYMLAPFWDPPRLAAEQALITNPTPATLAAAYRDRGTRWILADERSGRVSPLLDTLTDPVSVADGVHLYRLRPPQA